RLGALRSDMRCIVGDSGAGGGAPASSSWGLRCSVVEPVVGGAGGEARIYRREKVPEAVADGKHVGPLVEFDRRQEVPPLRLDVLVDADPLADVDLVLTRGQQLVQLGVADAAPMLAGRA